jgi:hypothetical protein
MWVNMDMIQYGAQHIQVYLDTVINWNPVIETVLRGFSCKIYAIPIPRSFCVPLYLFCAAVCMLAGVISEFGN